MKTITTTMVALCALFLTGCLAEEQGAHDDVDSRESAVEEAPAPSQEGTAADETPAPDQEDDLIFDQLHAHCVDGCYSAWNGCMFRCVARNGRDHFDLCDQLECASDHAQARGCAFNCDMIWPTGHGGNIGGIP